MFSQIRRVGSWAWAPLKERSARRRPYKRLGGAPMMGRVSAEQLRLLGFIGAEGQLELKSGTDSRMRVARGLESLGFLRSIPKDQSGVRCVFVLSGEGYMQCRREGLGA